MRWRRARVEPSAGQRDESTEKPKRIRIEPLASPAPPFFDDVEREIIGSSEAALQTGGVLPNAPEELVEVNAEWKSHRRSRARAQSE
jgi:hypothetical protein